MAELRRLHMEIDQSVAATYGWTDLDLGHGFHETKQGLHYTIGEAARGEVLALGEGHSPGRAAGQGQGKWTAWSKARCFGFA